MPRNRWVCLPFLSVFFGCTTTLQTVPSDWLSVPRATQIRSLTLSNEGKVAPSSQPAQWTLPKGSIRVTTNAVGPMIAKGDKPLTEPFMALDSFDVSDARGEVVFSGKRDDDFDVGLVSTDGSDISWVPNDPADEVQAQWAPRGNKISYVVRGKYGDLVRTVHVPTAATLDVDFPFARVNALAWDPQAERYAAAYSSPIASDAVDVQNYGGQQRSTVIKPAAKLDLDLQPFVGDAVLLQPLDIRYGEKLPVVIWRDEDALRWNDARADLMRNARVMLIVTTKEPDEALLKRVKETAVIDASRVFAVNCSVPGAVATIKPDTYLGEGKYRRNGGIVTVPPAVIESFAARFIAEQLERNSPANGSR